MLSAITLTLPCAAGEVKRDIRGFYTGMTLEEVVAHAQRENELCSREVIVRPFSSCRGKEGSYQFEFARDLPYQPLMRVEFTFTSDFQAEGINAWNFQTVR